MGIEIERKFIVPLEHHDLFLNKSGGQEIVQGYLSTEANRTIRIRTIEEAGEKSAYMTVKSSSTDGGLSRHEWEFDIPFEDAQGMLDTLKPPHVKKRRHRIPHEGYIWEVDVVQVNKVPNRAPAFYSYLVVAEVEAPTQEAVMAAPLPPWVGAEVTGDSTFAMSRLWNEGDRHMAWWKAYRCS